MSDNMREGYNDFMRMACVTLKNKNGSWPDCEEVASMAWDLLEPHLMELRPIESVPKEGYFLVIHSDKDYSIANIKDVERFPEEYVGARWCELPKMSERSE